MLFTTVPLDLLTAAGATTGITCVSGTGNICMTMPISLEFISYVIFLEGVVVAIVVAAAEVVGKIVVVALVDGVVTTAVVLGEAVGGVGVVLVVLVDVVVVGGSNEAITSAST